LRDLSSILTTATGSEVRFEPDDESSGISDEVLNLTTSRSFQRTHSAIAALRDVRDFTDAEVKEIADAYRSNDQIHLISGDADVKAFFQRFVRENWGRLDWSIQDLNEFLPF